MSDDASGIFEGLIVHTLPLPGRQLYASHDRIVELRERGVVLSVERDELQPLGERFARARRPGETMESPLEARLRKAWDWITGASTSGSSAACSSCCRPRRRPPASSTRRWRTSTASAHNVDDVTDSGRGEVAEMLRPFYLEYLRHRRADAASTP